MFRTIGSRWLLVFSFWLLRRNLRENSSMAIQKIEASRLRHARADTVNPSEKSSRSPADFAL